MNCNIFMHIQQWFYANWYQILMTNTKTTSWCLAGGDWRGHGAWDSAGPVWTLVRRCAVSGVTHSGHGASAHTSVTTSPQTRPHHTWHVTRDTAWRHVTRDTCSWHGQPLLRDLQQEAAPELPPPPPEGRQTLRPRPQGRHVADVWPCLEYN